LINNKWIIIALAAGIGAITFSANATTDGVCYKVRNVENWDVLNIRAARSASSHIVGTIPPQQFGIIAKAGSCAPISLPLASRWCQIAYYDGDVTLHGYVKRRYLEKSECP